MIHVDAEAGVITARVLLDEVTRQQQGGRGICWEEIFKLATEILKPLNLAPCYHPASLEYTITLNLREKAAA